MILTLQVQGYTEDEGSEPVSLPTSSAYFVWEAPGDPLALEFSIFNGDAWAATWTNAGPVAEYGMITSTRRKLKLRDLEFPELLIGMIKTRRETEQARRLMDSRGEDLSGESSEPSVLTSLRD